MISTHALREEGDQMLDVFNKFMADISTHALREEGDQVLYLTELNLHIFLPTPSARRATFESIILAKEDIFLPTPSARRATYTIYPYNEANYISTHALREEGDLS